MLDPPQLQISNGLHSVSLQMHMMIDSYHLTLIPVSLLSSTPVY